MLIIKKILSKNVLRLAVSYIFWSLFYDILMTAKNLILNGAFSIRNFTKTFIEGTYHLWFLPMIIGLYLCIPIFKAITKDRFALKLFLVLAGIFNFIIPTVLKLLTVPNLFKYGDIFTSINNFVGKADIKVVLGFSVYFLLGFYINTTDFSKKTRRIIYLLGIIGVVTTPLTNSLISLANGWAGEISMGAQNIGVVLMSIGIFTFFKYNIKGGKISAFFAAFSRYTFGAYLTHVLFIEGFAFVGLHSLSFSPLISVPVISLAILVLSLLASFILNKIPLINKYIV